MDANTSQHTANCLRCGRALRSAKSLARGYGPTCGAKVAQAADAAAEIATEYGFKVAQVAKAAEILEQGGLVATSRTGVYTAVASDGITRYLVQADLCTCQAGQNGRSCYHRLAVIILDSTRKAA